MEILHFLTISWSLDSLCFLLLELVVPLVTFPPTIVMWPAMVMGVRAATGAAVVTDLEAEGAAAFTEEVAGAATVGFALALTAVLLALVEEKFEKEVGIDETY